MGRRRRRTKMRPRARWWGLGWHTAAAMRLVEDNKVLGLVLVAAYDDDLGDELERNSGYFSRPWDWARIRTNAGFIGAGPRPRPHQTLERSAIHKPRLVLISVNRWMSQVEKLWPESSYSLLYRGMWHES